MARRLGLKSRIQVAAETQSTGFGDVRSVLLGVMRITMATKLVVALALTLRFAAGPGNPWGHCLWLGVFHAVSAFNNAGFALFSEGRCTGP
ncbi:hypothetical protein OIU93_08780 [Paeniglutamicibacter sp. ZC-3]|uniref:hypothetical protein n=1 Tax=Paeniglutamicibacter sp. ZC-3 TaxID=2986919 RepID=UPI0021F7A2E0|nr:hypothetical protein [Paeniglutamicibacter sp. ZC-3]MCV9994392.1 hypothetical protein [Paeniglutamicibacter sp. ZC-3]